MDDIGNEKPHLRESLAGDLKQGWDDTSRLDSRLESFSVLKHSTHEFVQWARNGGIPLFDKPTTLIFNDLDNCARYFIVENYQVSKRSRLVGGCSCKRHLLCAFCASRRGVRNARSYKKRVVILEQENPDLDMLFLTFTVKNGVDLVERFTHLRSAMKTILLHRNYQSVGRGKHVTEMSKLTGGAFAYEFKRGSGLDLWHPHIHMIAHIPKGVRIDAERLKAEWLDITQDSSHINLKYCSNDNPYLEVFAYALKFSQMTPQDRWHAAQLLRGDRLISSFGSFRGVDLSDDVWDDVLDTDEPFTVLLYRWLPHRGYGQPQTLTNPHDQQAA